MQVAQFARNTTPLSELPGFVTAASTAPSVITRGTLIDAYLQEYEVRQFRLDIGSGRAAHLRAYFGEACPVGEITAVRIRDYRSHEDRPAPRQPQSIERHLRSIECSELWCSGVATFQPDLPRPIARKYSAARILRTRGLPGRSSPSAGAVSRCFRFRVLLWVAQTRDPRVDMG